MKAGEVKLIGTDKPGWKSVTTGEWENGQWTCLKCGDTFGEVLACGCWEVVNDETMQRIMAKVVRDTA